MIRRSVLALACLSLIVAPRPAEAEEPRKHECQVYAASLDALDDLERAFQAATVTGKDYERLMREVEKDLGHFQSVVAEEVSTTKSFPLAGTDRIVTVTVYYTDESVPLSGGSMSLAIVVAKAPVKNALVEPGGALAEVDIEPDTFVVRVKQIAVIDGKNWVVGAECQCMSTEERKRQIAKAVEAEQ
jgi:hypothetical protein